MLAPSLHAPLDFWLAGVTPMDGADLGVDLSSQQTPELLFWFLRRILTGEEEKTERMVFFREKKGGRIPIANAIQEAQLFFNDGRQKQFSIPSKLPIDDIVKKWQSK